MRYLYEPVRATSWPATKTQKASVISTQRLRYVENCTSHTNGCDKRQEQQRGRYGALAAHNLDQLRNVVHDLNRCSAPVQSDVSLLHTVKYVIPLAKAKLGINTGSFG
jgi:hypothetical protein